MAIDQLETKLRPPAEKLAPYPSKLITLASGEKMVVRECRMQDAGALLGTVYPLLAVQKDFYDIVAARMYSEILGWFRYRVANEFVIVGAIDGVIAGIVTSRHVQPGLGMSLHTLTIKRGLRVGAQLFAAKMEHHIDYLGENEVHIVAESPIGFKRWMIEYELEDRSAQYPGLRHELGGVPTFTLTRTLWEAVKPAKCTGSRPVPPEIHKTADRLIMPEAYVQLPGWKRGRN
jgi:hypothetical protein